MTPSAPLIDHFNHPRNAGSFPRDEPNVGTGVVGTPDEGIVIKLQIKVGPNGVITAARFRTFGCSSAIASSSLVTTWVVHRTLEETLSIRDADIVAALSLPPEMEKCARMAVQAIHTAVDHYRLCLAPDGPAAPGIDKGDRI